MKKLQKFLKNSKVKFVGSVAGMALMALLALAPATVHFNQGGASLSYNAAYAACPAVPADCTIDDVIGDSLDTVKDQALATLVVAVPVLVGGAIIFALGFKVIKMGFRWVLKYIR